jgi:1-acyl-sn-glycerol-3-phosphate acyltransferase
VKAPETRDEFLARRPELREDGTSARAVRWVTALTAAADRWFRFRISGLERVPDGPCLLVANHSIGAPFEILLLHRAFRRRFGGRLMYGLVHRIAWQLPFRLFPIAQKIGGLYAHPDIAIGALARGGTVLVFPGGDLEAMRPFSQRHVVTFAGRCGFARLARRTGVPVVPVVVCGAHATFVMLPGALRVGRLLRTRRVYGFRAFPFTLGALLFAVAVGVSAFRARLWPLVPFALLQMLLPLPSRIEAEVLTAERPRQDETDEDFAARVERAMQAAMDHMAGRRRTVWG